MPYELSDMHTSSDIGLVAFGRNAEELFVDSALGMVDIMADRDSLDESRAVEIDLSSDNLDELYFDWLSEIIYFKDAEYFMPKRIEIGMLDTEKFQLKASLHGETINPSKHILKVDVKAVTRYRFKIEFSENKWQGEVVFDL